MMGAIGKEDLSVTFEGIEDPRIERHKQYPIYEIIFCALYAALCGVESWRGIEIVCNEHLQNLKNYFNFDNGIASHQTISRVFSLLKPKSFEQFFTVWTSTIYGSNDKKNIAIDGKTLRGSFDTASAKNALHILNVCAVENGITLAQLEVDSKTNEITAVPEIIDQIDIKGATVSVDALNTQKEIAAKIISAGADYTLALKGNHKNLNEDVSLLFDTSRITEENIYEEIEKSNGRITTRNYKIIPVNEENLECIKFWTGLKSVGCVTSTVFKNGKETEETRYYLLSYTNVVRFAVSARGHWGIENKLHWSLDVVFDEDGSRKRKDHAPRNYSLIRKFALNILRTCKGKLSVPLAQIKACSNLTFLNQMLTNSGFQLINNGRLL